MIGEIKEISTVDGQMIAIIKDMNKIDGSGPEVTATIMQSGGSEFYPLVGDKVVYHRTGQEIVVTGIFAKDTDTSRGEGLLFSRSAAGTIAATVHLKANGAIEVKPGTGQVAAVGNGADFVAMAAKVDASIEAIATAIEGAGVQAGDGGAVFKGNIVTALGISLPLIGSVASTNLKAD